MEYVVARSCIRLACSQALTYGQQLGAARSEQLNPLHVIPTCSDVVPNSSLVWVTLCSCVESRDAHLLLRMQSLYTGRKDRGSVAFQAAVEEVLHLTLLPSPDFMP